MTIAFDPRIDARHAAWCGRVLLFAAVLAPLLGWLAPLGFAPLAGLCGLMAAGAVRLDRRHLPGLIAAMALLIWAGVSVIWSPYRPEDAGGWTAMKLVAQAAGYWAFVCAADQASPSTRRTALTALAWGMALLGLILVAEALSGAAIYQAVKAAINDPIRPDLAARNVAQGGYVLAVLAAPAAVAALRVGAPPWLGAVMAAGVAASAIAFDADAPLLALVLGAAAAAGVMLWPRVVPRVLAVGAAFFFLGAPMMVLGAKASGVYARIQDAAPLSWAQRMGYWSHATRWIGDHPIRGWGLDASRVFGPGIRLHPHDAALQVWLELGFIGAAAAAAFWAVVFLRMTRKTPDLGVAAGAGAAVVYLVFGAVSFGVWQEWWLAMGALAAVFALAVERHSAPQKPMRTSTAVTISE